MSRRKKDFEPAAGENTPANTLKRDDTKSGGLLNFRILISANVTPNSTLDSRGRAFKS